jgi:two-component system response regulator
MNRSKPIFLVEDNADDEALFVRALAKKGIKNEIVIARDGVEALERLYGSEPISPSVIFLDLKIPKIDGLQILERVRADARTATFPVVILTSSDEPGDVARAYALGVNSYVRKPIEFAQFSETVGDLGAYWLFINELPS